MIMSRVKRLLQSVEEASSPQIAADLGVDRKIAAATLEHLCAMGKVVRRRPGAGLPGSASEAATGAASGSAKPTTDECTERIGCASCPLVRVCDPKVSAVTPTAAGAGQPKEEVLYAWMKN